MQQLSSISPALFQVIRFDLRKGDRRKLQILESAIHCLATRGIERTTFEEIGRRIGIRKSHVAYHFPDMENLIETAMRYVLVNVQNDVVQRVKSEIGWRKAVEAQARGTIEWVRSFPEHAQVYLLFCYRCSYEASFRAINKEFREVGIRRLMGILEPVAKESRVGKKELRLLACRAVDLIFGALFTCVSWEPSENIDVIIENTIKGEMALIESVLSAARGVAVGE